MVCDVGEVYKSDLENMPLKVDGENLAAIHSPVAQQNVTQAVSGCRHVDWVWVGSGER